MANSALKTNESGSQTETSVRRCTEESERATSGDPLPNIKFTKRKMRIDHVKSKNKHSESQIQVVPVLSPKVFRSKPATMVSSMR